MISKSIYVKLLLHPNPNKEIQQVVQKSSDKNTTLALLVPDTSWWYCQKIIEGATLSCKKNNVSLRIYVGSLLESIHPTEKQRNIIYNFINKNDCDAIISITGTMNGYVNDTDLNNYFKTKYDSIPIVSIATPLEGYPFITIDNKKGFAELMDHLIIDHGYKRIAYLSGLMNNSDDFERLETYKEALTRNSIDIDQRYIIDCFFDPQGFKIALTNLLEDTIPEVIVCASDDIALGLNVELAELGIKIPHDIAFTGFDNIPSSTYIFPPLTTVKQPIQELGVKAVEVALDSLHGCIEKDKIALPTNLVKRQSCGCVDIHKNNIELSHDSDIIRNDSFKEKYNQFQDKIEEITKLFHATVDGKIESDSFFDFLNNEIFHNKVEYEDLTIYREVLFRIMAKLNKQNGNGKNIINEALKLIENVEKMLSNRDYFLGKDRTWGLGRCIDRIRDSIHLDELLDVMIKELPTYNLSSMTLAIYEHELNKIGLSWDEVISGGNSQKVKILLGKKNGIFQKIDSSINLDKLLNGCSLEVSKDDIFYVYPICSQWKHYGFILIEYGQNNIIDYIDLAFSLSSIFEIISKVDEVESKNRELDNLNKSLENKVQERTAELESANLKLKDLDSLKNDFIANVTHDFRSPLTIIHNNADIAIKYDQNNKKEMKRKLKTIYAASEKLKSAIDRLLDLAKMDAEGVKLKIQSVKPKLFLTQLIDFYRSSTFSSNINLLELFPLHEIDNFYTDIDKLEEILSNILSNAIKYIDLESGEIIIHLEETDKSVIFKIEDNGIGIKKEDLDSIFNRFEQIESGKNSIHKGTGLGLAFSKQLTKFLKGKISVESKGLGHGATFILEFPKGSDIFNSDYIDKTKTHEDYSNTQFKSLIMENIDQKIISENRSITVQINKLNEIDEFDYKKGLVLLVDDNQDIRDIELLYLKNNGYLNFICANDGVQGIEAAYKYRPDFIICDYNMPRMKGDEFHDNLITNPDFRKVPILFVTAMADRTLLLDRQRKGAVAYLGKPIREDEFIATVDIHFKKYMEYKEVLIQATIDELTGLNNRRNLMKILNKNLAIRNKKDFSLVFFDIDHFKNLNDTYGHQLGDKVLKELGYVVSDSLRTYDTAGRYGGEEFLLLLNDTNITQAKIVAEKLRKKFKEIVIKHKDKEITITVSFGIASLYDNESSICQILKIDNLKTIYQIEDSYHVDWESISNKKEQIKNILIEFADKALYNAKSTCCKECGFISEKSTLFKNDRCPKCNSLNLSIGRDKIICYGDPI